jgi:AraC-like DNA-binding protein
MHAIRLIKPAPQLQRYVRFYAQRSVCIPDVVVHPVTARAVPLLDFILGDPFRVFYRERSFAKTAPRVSVVGLQTHCRSQLELRGTIDSFVIAFQPTGLHRLFSVPMHELTDRDYEAHSVLGPFVSNLEQRLSNCRTIDERSHVADQFFTQRIPAICDTDGVSAAANQILLRGGSASISALADSTGLSMRQFQRGFANQVGMPPKLYSRIARFEAALDSKARSTTKSWTDVAHEFGYYDQMHMVHDFEDFTGETPSKTLNQVESLFRGQIAALRSGKLPPIASSDSRFIL